MDTRTYRFIYTCVCARGGRSSPDMSLYGSLATAEAASECGGDLMFYIYELE